MDYQEAWNTLESWLEGKESKKAEQAEREPCEEMAQDLGAQAYAFGSTLEQMRHFEAKMKDCGAGTPPDERGPGEPMTCEDCRANWEQADEDSGPELTPDETGDPSNPSHYSLFDGEKETMDLIRDRMTTAGFWGYLYGNAIKYLTRWRHKHDELDGQIADLKKCRMYIDLLIDSLEGGQ